MTSETFCSDLDSTVSLQSFTFTIHDATAVDHLWQSAWK